MNTKQKLFRDLAVGFIAFMASIILVSLSVLIIFEKTLFTPEYLNRAAVKANYYESLTKQINLEIQDIGLGSSIPADVLDNVVKVPQVEKDFEANAFQAFRGADYTIDKESFSAQTKGPIMAYSETLGREITAESLEAIERFTEEAATIYSDFIKLPYLQDLGQKIAQFESEMMLFKIILSCSLALIIILIIYLLHWWWHRLYRYLAYIFSGSGLMLIGVPFLILSKGVIERVSIDSQPLYQLLTMYLKTSLITFIYVGLSLIALAIISGISSSVLRNRVIIK